MSDSFTGIVIQGDKEGRAFGFPTANIRVPNNLKSGIYSGTAIVNGKIYRSAIMINPARVGQVIESYIIGFNSDLYGKEITITVEKFIRPWVEFSDLEAGKQQIKKDIEIIKSMNI